MPGPRRDRIDFSIVERGGDLGGRDVLLPFKKRYVRPGLQIGHGSDAMSRAGILGARVPVCNGRTVDAVDNVWKLPSMACKIRPEWYDLRKVAQEYLLFSPAASRYSLMCAYP